MNQFAKYALFACILLPCIASQLSACIHHVLHQTRNEDFHCDGDEELHFYSTYVLPDGAYRCLEQMRGKTGFYVSTVRQLGELTLTEKEIEEGKLVRPQLSVKGWACSADGLVRSANFVGVELRVDKCRHK